MKFPDETPCELTLAYKSGNTHITQTEVGIARKRSKTAIRRHSVKWIRVSIPHPTLNKEVRFYYNPVRKNWERSFVILPRTKD